MKDDVLGLLAQQEDELVGSLPDGKRTIELRIRLDGVPPMEVLLLARELKQNFQATVQLARRELLALLPTVNGGYREPGEEPLSPEEFLGRASLELVQIGSEGDITFTFADDDMLWGHWMTVTRDREKWNCSFWG